MANTSHTCPHDIINVGQFRMTTPSLLTRLNWGVYEQQIRLPEIDVKGATVVDPICGAHGTASDVDGRPTDNFLDLDSLDPEVRSIVDRVLTEEERRIYEVNGYVGTLDFASLYPSIIMSYLMCIFLIILPNGQGDSKVERAYKRKSVPTDNLVVHEEVVYEDDDSSKAVIRRHRFVQNAREPYRRGIIPGWQADLKVMRKHFKKLMVSNPEMRGVYNARQLAIKISMNSVYGVSKQICSRITEAVTNRGRFMLAQVIKAVTEMGLTVVYGDTDSVMVKSPADAVALDQAWSFFENLETQLNDELFSREGDVNALEFENSLTFLLLGKKAYFMNKKEKCPSHSS